MPIIGGLGDVYERKTTQPGKAEVVDYLTISRSAASEKYPRGQIGASRGGSRANALKHRKALLAKGYKDATIAEAFAEKRLTGDMTQVRQGVYIVKKGDASQYITELSEGVPATRTVVVPRVSTTGVTKPIQEFVDQVVGWFKSIGK